MPRQALPLPLILTGPTACGKSAVALALAAELPLEVISVDSALVYRGMDIGTAKPSAAERTAVTHHLIDILDPAEHYSAARFVADVTQRVAEITARGRLPLLVGGTLMYVNALRQGLHALPAAEPALRAAIEARAARLGWPALHAELAAVDAPTAARLAPNDAQRIQRALEVFQASGTPLSQWLALKPATPAIGAGWPVVSLEPESRAWLHTRIGQRLDAMLAAGFVDEVRALRARGDLHAELPSMRCVGYRQAWEALDTGDMAALRERAVFATRQLAKRQITWLRHIPDRTVVPADAPDALRQALAALRARTAAT